MKSAGIYLRVSTDPQESRNQLPGCRQLAAARGLDVVEIYADEGVSGDARKRPALERALLDAHAGRFQVLVAWSVDRLSRDGATGLLKLLERLDAAGVAFITAQEPYLDSAGPFRDVVLALLGTFARMEKARLLERLRAARVRMEAAGKAWGRPRRMSPEQVERAQELREQGRSFRAIAVSMRVPRATVRRSLARVE